MGQNEFACPVCKNDVTHHHVFPHVVIGPGAAGVCCSCAAMLSMKSDGVHLLTFDEFRALAPQRKKSLMMVATALLQQRVLDSLGQN